MRTLDRFVAHDGAFARVTGRAPRLAKVIDCPAHEGPVYGVDDDVLYATSLPTPEPAASILRLDGDRFPLEPERAAVVIAGVTMPNGMTMDAAGRLVVCEQGNEARAACISRVDPATGDRRVVVDAWKGRRFNSPNDVVVADDGAVWFTDPSYGHLQGFRPAPEVGDFVYRWDRSNGSIDVVADGFDKPNGIALSPDGSTLYVTDSGANQTVGSFHVDRPDHVVAFDVVAAGGRTPPLARRHVPRVPGRAEGRRRPSGLRFGPERRARAVARGRPARRDRRPRCREPYLRRSGRERPLCHV